MTKTQRTIALLAALMTAASLASCGSGSSSSAGSSTGSSGSTDKTSSVSSAAADSGERSAIEWLTTGDTAAEVIEDGDRIVEAINEKLGIDLQVTCVP